MAVRRRRDIWRLARWDPIVEWYARAVAEMQRRPLPDPTSWRYQAAIHAYDRGRDPNARSGEALPSQAEQGRFWNQCQHFTWFFLPWHRIYLSCFERIVAQAVIDLGGPPDWALPYWNYSDRSNPNARRIPEAFRASTLPDGTPNPLRVRDRTAGNDGAEVGNWWDVDLRRCLREPEFIAQTGGSAGFGGSRTGSSHAGGTAQVAGEVERVPHGTMHSQVGGGMGFFNTAGLDPLFWLHHANIDRLWEVWRRRNAAHRDPPDPQWRTGVRFEFHDERGTIVSHVSADVVATTAPPLEYEYEDVSDPLAIGPGAAEARRSRVTDRIPEMLGSTTEPLELGGDASTTAFRLGRPTGPTADRPAAAGEARPEVYLNIENVKGSGRPVSYGVYVNVPPGESPDDHQELFAGILPMFGLSEATASDERHPGSGLTYALDITDIVRRLEQRDAWDPDNIQVTFVARGAAGEHGAAAAAERPITVGRVSLYVA